jgi:hypothetical protein
VTPRATNLQHGAVERRQTLPRLAQRGVVVDLGSRMRECCGGTFAYVGHVSTQIKSQEFRGTAECIECASSEWSGRARTWASSSTSNMRWRDGSSSIRSPLPSTIPLSAAEVFTRLRRLSILCQPLGGTAALMTRTSTWAGVFVAVQRFKYGEITGLFGRRDEISLEKSGLVHPAFGEERTGAG